LPHGQREIECVEKWLKTALKAEIDAGAGARLYATESRPFDRPDSDRIAVKVVND
jgi:adenine-specific DNA-methyltransferase